MKRKYRQAEFWEAYKRFAEEARKGDFFWPGYLEEIRPNAYAVLEAKEKSRVSADEKRVVPNKSRRRGSR